MNLKLYFGIILVTLFFSVYEKTNAQSPNWLWAKKMSGTGAEIGYSIAIDSIGNVFTTGHFTGIVDFDPGAGTFNLNSAGARDIFISKLDNVGNFVWAKTIGGTNDDFGYSIALDQSGNIFTTGFFRDTVDFDPGVGILNLTSAGNADIFISKLDSTGNFIWAKALGGTLADVGYSLTIDPTGNVYTTGSFYGTADFDPSMGIFNLTALGVSADIFISKLDSSGNFVWAKRMGGTLHDYGYSIALVPLGSGDVYTTGSFAGTVDFDPGAGVFNISSAGFAQLDIFISKLDSAGNFVWAKAIGGTSTDVGITIAIDLAGSGDIYTTGSFEGIVDFDPGAGVFNLTTSILGGVFISKLDSSGNFVWAKTIGGTSNPYGNSIVLDPAGSGDVYITGSFQGTSDFDPNAGVFNLTSAGKLDIFISKLSVSGNFIWAKAVGGDSSDVSRAIALDASGNVHVTGFFASPSISFGSTTLINNSTNYAADIFISKLDTTIITGNNEIENLIKNILLFPNPATNNLTIALGSTNKIIALTIADITGKIIYTTIATDTQKVEVNTKDFAEGTYVVQIQTADFIEMKKLIVKK